jgi:acetoin utilization deacetylase AcuC-like enzyme
MGATSYDVVLLAVGSGLAAGQAVLRGDVTNAYAMLRPPGQHAWSDKAMGFCLFNNVAIAAKIARQQWGIERAVSRPPGAVAGGRL